MTNKKRILLVEDDKVLRDNTATFLSKSNFLVYTAKDGVSGIQKAIAIVPDLIISDIIMPGMNGYDFFKALQQLPDTAIIPFIFLSSKGEIQEVRSGMNLGADDYLTKPFDYAELLKTIHVRIAKSETLLKAGETKFSAIIHNSLTGVFIYKDNSFLFTNKKFQEITGYSEEELHKMNFTDLLADNDREQVIDRLNAFQNSLESNMEMSFSIRTKSGQVVKTELFAGISKMQWKTVITAVVTESKDKAGSANTAVFADSDGGQALTQISERYSGSLKATEKYILEGGMGHLTKRELEVLQNLAKGLTSNEIAEALFISPRTVEFHRSNILSKTQTKNTAELIRYAIKHQLV